MIKFFKNIGFSIAFGILIAMKINAVGEIKKIEVKLSDSIIDYSDILKNANPRPEYTTIAGKDDSVFKTIVHFMDQYKELDKKYNFLHIIDMTYTERIRSANLIVDAKQDLYNWQYKMFCRVLRPELYEIPPRECNCRPELNDTDFWYFVFIAEELKLEPLSIALAYEAFGYEPDNVKVFLENKKEFNLPVFFYYVEECIALYEAKRPANSKVGLSKLFSLPKYVNHQR